MATYTIDFSDPLKPSFDIASGGYNGPGSSQAKTSLRLYGDGAIAWGESVDENMLRLAEHFASATPPPNPIGGQMWAQQALYRLVSGAAWYWYDITSPLANKWRKLEDSTEEGAEKLIGSASGNATPPASVPGFDGAHYYYVSADGKTRELYRYGSIYKQAETGWHVRTYEDVETSPDSATVAGKPTQSALIYNEFNGSWEPLGGAGATAATISAVAHPPAFTGTNVQTALDQIATGVLLKSGGTMTGTLVLKANPVNAMEAATKQYVDGIISSSLPRGFVGMWSPTAGPVPAGWSVCDGSNGTPDMRERFIIAAGPNFPTGTTGGSKTSSPAGAHSHSTNTTGAHSHGGATSPTVLTVDQIPAHKHVILGVKYPNNDTGPGAAGPGWTDGGRYGTYPDSKITENTGSGQGHAHSITSDGSHSHSTNTVDNHTHDTTVPYYAVVFIMKL